MYIHIHTYVFIYIPCAAQHARIHTLQQSLMLEQLIYIYI